jgi:hypothetical protein
MTLTVLHLSPQANLNFHSLEENSREWFLKVAGDEGMEEGLPGTFDLKFQDPEEKGVSVELKWERVEVRTFNLLTTAKTNNTCRSVDSASRPGPSRKSPIGGQTVLGSRPSTSLEGSSLLLRWMRDLSLGRIKYLPPVLNLSSRIP